MRTDRRRLVCLDSDTDDRLADRAARRGLAVSAMIRTLILDYLEKTDRTEVA